MLEAIVQDQDIAFQFVNRGAGQFDAIRITDFEVGQIDFGEEHATATVRVTYHAYSMQSMLEREIEETQRWERVGKGNEWFVRPELEGLVGQVADSR